MPEGYRLWVNETRTVLVRVWPDGRVEVAIRESANGLWGAPQLLEEEK